MGWTFNVVDADAPTNAPTIAAVGIVFTVLSALVVSLRLYVRSSIVKKIGIDDWIIVVTWKQDGDWVFKMLSTCLLRISIILDCSHMHHRLHKFAIVGIAITCSTFHFCLFVVQLHLCNPVAKKWDPSITTGTCIPTMPLYTAMAVITIIFEVLILLTPLPILLYSKFSPRKNLLTPLIYTLATFVTLIQVIRLLSIKHQTSSIDGSALILWSTIEISLGISSSSLLSLSPLFKSFLSSETDTFRLSLKIDHAKMVVKRAGRESPTWQRVILFLGYGELKGQRTESRNGSRLESRSNSRMDGWNGEGGDWSTEELNFEMGIIKTAEVIISREGSTRDEPKSTGLEAWKEEP